METVTGGRKEKEMLELHPSAWKRTSHEDLAQACGVENVLTHDTFTQLLYPCVDEHSLVAAGRDNGVAHLQDLGREQAYIQCPSVAQWLSADGETAPIAMMETSVKP